MENEVNRACIIEIDPKTGQSRVYASGLRNPVGLAWEPHTRMLWVAVNERDELGSDLVPDYMTSVKEGGFYGWPYSYYGAHVERASNHKSGSRGEGDLTRLRAGSSHRIARARVLAGNQSRASGRRGHVRRPARVVEPQAEKRLQGDLRTLRRRPAIRHAEMC